MWQMTEHVYKVGDKPVARLCGRTLCKVVKGSVHQLRKPPAWAIDAAVLEQARRDGALVVEVLDTETGVTYWAAISAFRRWGFDVDRGCGRQIALPLARWQLERGDDDK
jgi:hypothetical protein